VLGTGRGSIYVPGKSLSNKLQVPCSHCFLNLIEGKKVKIIAICSWVLLPLQPPTSYKPLRKPISATHSPIFLGGRTGTGGLKYTSDQRSPSTAQLCLAGTSC